MPPVPELSTDSSSIVVVGASLAGLRACETLREEGFGGRLYLVGEEWREPYDRPPLSKEVLTGKWEPERTALRREGLEALGLERCFGELAVSLDVEGRTVVLESGLPLRYDGLVIATGAKARRLELVEGFAGVHFLRTLDDAMALRRALVRETPPRVAVIGAGFIGCEVASSCRSLGLEVTVVEPLAAPMVRALGRHLGGLAARLLRDHGVDLRCGVSLVGVEGDGRVERLRLSDGRTVEADVVVAGVGVRPSTEWLEGAGLELDDGVICDERCSVAPGIVAAGDVARWKSLRSGRHVRIEHWTNAGAQGRAAALRLLHGEEAVEPYDPVPYVWTDQFGVKIQVGGHPAPDDELHLVDGAFEEFRFVALFARRGLLTGVVGMRRPRLVMEYLSLLEEGATIEDALARKPR